MKTEIKPEEEGINVDKIRGTKPTDLLVQLKKRNGQATKLQKALQHRIGEKIIWKKIKAKVLQNIRDIDEAVENAETIDGVLNAAGESGKENIKAN